MNERSADPVGSGNLAERIERLRRALAASWSAETTLFERFNPAQPVDGQCIPTVLVVQDHLGGELLSGTAWFDDGPDDGGLRHYWNQVAGADLDLTSEQFPPDVEMTGVHLVDRDDLLASKRIRDRYEILADAVRERLAIAAD